VHPKLKEKEPRNKNEVQRQSLSNEISTTSEVRRSMNSYASGAEIERKARECGIAPKPGESYDELKHRVNIALKTRNDRQ
jgi:hypothetical protein